MSTAVETPARPWNPYLDEWRDFQGDFADRFLWLDRETARVEGSQGFGMGAGWRDWMAHTHLERRMRPLLISRYAFSIPTEEALAAIGKRGPVVEMGAGTGYWSRCLRDRGVDVMAYDHFGEDWRGWFRPLVMDGGVEAGDGPEVAETVYPWVELRHDPEADEPRMWTHVELGGPERLAEHSDRTLLLCWPNLGGPFGGECLRRYQGGCVVFVGDPEHCGDDRFRETLERRWRPVEQVDLPQWESIRDGLWVLERR